MNREETLSVRIPKRFKENLDYRFNPRNAKRDSQIYCIKTSCPLCEEFFDHDCLGCPFEDFQTSRIRGCGYWVKSVLDEYPLFRFLRNQVCWSEIVNKEAREQLKAFRRKAKRLIIWEEVEK